MPGKPPRDPGVWERGRRVRERRGGRPEPGTNLWTPPDPEARRAATVWPAAKGRPGSPGELGAAFEAGETGKAPEERAEGTGGRPRPRPEPPVPARGGRQLPVPSQESSPPGSRFRNLYQNVSTRPGSAPSCAASASASSTSPSHRPGSCSASAPAPAELPAGLRRTAPRGSQRPSSGRDPTTSSSGRAPATAGGTTTPNRNRMAAGGAAPGVGAPRPADVAGARGGRGDWAAAREAWSPEARAPAGTRARLHLFWAASRGPGAGPGPARGLWRREAVAGEVCSRGEGHRPGPAASSRSAAPRGGRARGGGRKGSPSGLEKGGKHLRSPASLQLSFPKARNYVYGGRKEERYGR